MGFDKRSFREEDMPKGQQPPGNGRQDGRQDKQQGKQTEGESLRQGYKKFTDINSLEKFLNSPFVLAGFVAACIAVMAGYHFLKEDIYSTRAGWDALPLNMADVNTGWWVAVSLSVAPIFFYTLYLVSENRIASYLAFLCVVADGLLDMRFRVHTEMQINFGAWLNESVWAFLVSFGVFTIMSEIAFTGGAPLVFFLAPYAWKQLLMLISQFVAFVYEADDWLHDNVFSKRNK